MKIKKEIDKEIIILIIESILITVIIIWIATLIGKWMLNNRRNVYVSNEVVVDIDSKIKGKLPISIIKRYVLPLSKTTSGLEYSPS